MSKRLLSFPGSALLARIAAGNAVFGELAAPQFPLGDELEPRALQMKCSVVGDCPRGA